jgi:hypothetical protein
MPYALQVPIFAYSKRLTFARGVHRGRTASCPTTPAQIPACGIIAPGFSEVFASAKALSQTRGDAHDCALGTTYNTWFSNAKPFHQLIKANPIVTLTLAAPIEKFPQRSDGIEIERIETGQVSIYTEVIVTLLQKVRCTAKHAKAAKKNQNHESFFKTICVEV